MEAIDMLSDVELLDYYTGNNNKCKIISSYPPQIAEKITPSIDEEFFFSKHSPVQASSIDLHVGKIIVPKKGKKGKPWLGYSTKYDLEVGETIIVGTKEDIALPGDLAGVVFPPSALSSKGILVSNIGHIDPGFEGKLRFTVINMGG